MDVGLVAVSRGPAGDIYELNRDHILADKIADLYRLDSLIEQELTSFLRDELLALTNKVESATLFGSAVWGGSTPTSDIDLAVSCKAQDVQEVEEALERLSDTAHRRFGNRLSPLIKAGRQSTKREIWKRVETEGVSLIRSSKGVRP
jgi:predicted nucleotidyltransferase